MYQEDHWGGHFFGGPMGWSIENRLAMLEKKEKMLEAKLEFIRKIKGNLKKEMEEKGKKS